MELDPQHRKDVGNQKWLSEGPPLESGSCETKLGEVGLFSVAVTEVKVGPACSEQTVHMFFLVLFTFTINSRCATHFGIA